MLNGDPREPIFPVPSEVAKIAGFDWSVHSDDSSDSDIIWVERKTKTRGGSMKKLKKPNQSSTLDSFLIKHRETDNKNSSTLNEVSPSKTSLLKSPGKESIRPTEENLSPGRAHSISEESDEEIEVDPSIDEKLENIVTRLSASPQSGTRHCSEFKQNLCDLSSSFIRNSDVTFKNEIIESELETSNILVGGVKEGLVDYSSLREKVFGEDEIEGMFSREDFDPDDYELYLLQCPTELDVQKMLNSDICLNGVSGIKLENEEQKYEVFSQKEKFNKNINLIIPSRATRNFNFVSFQLDGNIIISESIEVNEEENEKKEHFKTPLPLGNSMNVSVEMNIKKRNENNNRKVPFPDYLSFSSRLLLASNEEKDSTLRLSENEGSLEDISFVRRKKKKQPLEFDFTEVMKTKKRKKKKNRKGERDNEGIDEGRNTTISSVTSLESEPLTFDLTESEGVIKKKKKKKREKDNEDTTEGNTTITSVTSFKSEPLIFDLTESEGIIKKKKKKKREKDNEDATDGNTTITSVTSLENETVIFGLPETVEKIKKKKKKKEKHDEHFEEGNTTMSSLACLESEPLILDLTESDGKIKKKKKKKREKDDDDTEGNTTITSVTSFETQDREMYVTERKKRKNIHKDEL